MGIRDLIEWVEKQKFKGEEPEDLKHQLVDKGWKASQVAKAVDSVWQGTQDEILQEINWKKSSLWGISLLVVLAILLFPFFSPDQSVSSSPEKVMVAKGTGECSDLAQNMFTCEPSLCEFEKGGEFFQRSLFSLGEECQYTEQMPGGGKMECVFSPEIRKAAARQYNNLDNFEDSSFELFMLPDNTSASYNISGEFYSNPLKEAFKRGECSITGYSDDLNVTT